MKRLVYLFLFLIGLASCGGDHLIKDSKKLVEIKKAFKQRQKEINNPEVWKIFDTPMSTSEKEAMMFLYAYMPLNDFADYDGTFFLRNVKYALKTKTEFSWGKKVPETEFIHFVLPHRINNENLDSSRVVFFNELKDRVKNLNMYQAALEVNHWCHEKVTYRGADIRTSAPLATVRSAIGRCGEESTFTVQALRSVGIPARQVYTPRWAHSDDNHAWVEVYVDGKWYFLGACEPSADLNQGWFSEPARRAMLIHTKAFGFYSGTERVMNRKRFYTELNTLPTYANTKEITVKVIGQEGLAMEGVEVGFMLYNYAELYPLTTKKSDFSGECSFLTGLGDLLIWAKKDGFFGYKKISVSEQNSVTIKVDNLRKYDEIDDIDFVPPVEMAPLHVSKKGVEENNKKLKEEDAIRKAYENSFMTEAESFKLANKLELKKSSIAEFIKKSRGNHVAIKKFIEEASKIDKSLVVDYLNSIADKDLRDAPYGVIISDFKHSVKYKNENKSLYNRYVLSPRIRNEFLTNYKEVFQKEFSSNQIEQFRLNPYSLIKHINKTIKIDEEGMYYNLPMLPTGVHSLKITNSQSRNIYFVALCRAFGIPARLKLSETPQFYLNGWKDAQFDKKDVKSNPKAKINFAFKGKNFTPKYYIDFTIAKLENGAYKTLEFDWTTAYNKFDKNIEVEAGYYYMVTGNRMNDGSVLSKLKFFEIKEGENKTLKIDIRKNREADKIFGKLNLKRTLPTLKGDQLKLNTTPNKKGLVAVWLDPDREPTKHLFQDLVRLKESFEKRNYSILAITPRELLTASFKPEKYDFPKGIKYSITDENNMLREAFKSMGKDFSKVKYPVVMCLNSKNEIILLSQGYKIGLGEMIMKTMK